MKAVRYIGSSHVRVLTVDDVWDAYGVVIDSDLVFDKRIPSHVADGILVPDDLVVPLIDSGEWTGDTVLEVDPGLRWVFFGDEIVNGSGASTFARSFMPQAVQNAGGMIARPDLIESGWNSDEATDVRARMDGVVNVYDPNGTVIMAGTVDVTNDVQTNVTVDALKDMIQRAKEYGPVVICTIPPRAGPVDPNHYQTAAINIWIRTYAPGFGAEVAECWAALVDVETGFLNSIYDSGNGIHPNDLGHQKMAIEVAKAMIRASGRVAPYGLVWAEMPDQFIPDPLALGGGSKPTSWEEWSDAVPGERVIRIMPFGDSITQGFYNYIGYRRGLWNLLVDAEYSVEFVGSQTGYIDSVPGPEDYDTNHEGHGGWQISQLRDSAEAWVGGAQPDIVLVHAGTNDARSQQSGASSVTELGQLIDEIRAGKDNAVIVIAKIIPEDEARDPIFNINGWIDDMNAGIDAMVASKTTTASPVHVVDQWTGFDKVADSWDGIHPNESGAAKMAAIWFDKVAEIIDETDPDFWSTPPPPSGPPVSIFTEEDEGIENADPLAVEIGMKFWSEIDGFVSAVRFYKTINNVGPHTGRLWTIDGTLLGTVVFTGETATGWQTQAFDTPIGINADQHYIITYHTASGYYASGDQFTTQIDVPPLHVPAGNEPTDPNGVFEFGSGGIFPNDFYQKVNNMVDLEFVTGTPSSYSIVNDTYGVLPPGAKWAQMDLSGGGTGELRRLSAGGSIDGLGVVGDKIILTHHLQVEDVTGTWLADCANGTSEVSVELVDQNGDVFGVALQKVSGIPRSPTSKVYDIGPIVYPAIIPTGTTEVHVWFSLKVGVGKRLKMRVGCAAIFNATTMQFPGSFPLPQEIHT